MLTIQFLCPLPNGLHARPAWELKEQCSQWQSEITLLTIARTQRPMRKARWR
ncbi:HPr family phosphocarrier protein [Escherichia coli]